MIHQSPVLLPVLLCFLTSSPFQVDAQEDEGEVIIVSERVGDVIDVGERNDFRLFLDTQGFESAVFFSRPDGNYTLRITYVDGTSGEKRIKSVPRTESEIRQIGEYIDNFERILAGEYEYVIEHETPETFKAEKPVLSGTPPLNEGRIVAEVLVGGVGATVGGVAGIFIHILTRVSLEGGGIHIGLLGAICVGSSAGVYLIGNEGGETGSFLVTLIGSGLGYLVGDYLEESNGYFSFLVLPSIGAVVGFNATRRYKPPTRPGTALINFSDGQASLATPVICFRRSLKRKASLLSLNLVTASF